MASILYRFNRVIMVDSLPKDQWQTGRELFHDKLRWIRERHEGLDSEYHRVMSSAELITFLGDLARQTRTSGIAPILHIEAHGDKNGLMLANGEHVAWSSLKDALLAINHACRNNLFLMLATCEGGHIIELLTSAMVERAPFVAMIGANSNISFSDAAAFGEFYDVLFQNFDGTAALERLNALGESGERMYSLVSCEDVFVTIFQQYLKIACTPQAIESRILRVEMRVRFNSGEKDVRPEGRKWLSKKFQRKNQEPYFLDYRRRFLMIDDFPENDDRFTMTFQNCLERVDGA